MGVGKLIKESTRKGMKKGAMLGAGINTAFAYSDYKTAREEGSSRLGSVTRAAATFAAGEVLGFGMLPLMMAPSMVGGAIGGIESLGKMQRQMERSARPLPFGNSMFKDNNSAFTMRQAGMKIAEQSQYNLQQTLMGNEASLLR